MLKNLKKWQFYCDVGGTFTDCIGSNPEGQVLQCKVLSSPSSPIIAIQQLTGAATIEDIPASDLVLGTTIATNALLEKKGVRHALLITKGFGDILAIGTQQRRHLFSVKVEKPATLYETVVEVDERISVRGEVIKAPDWDKVALDLQTLFDHGYRSLAIVFCHGYLYPHHEAKVASLAKDLGFSYVSVSHEICPEIGFIARGDTVSLDAYLTPLVQAYLENLQRMLPQMSLTVIASNGALMSPKALHAHQAILSGPAGGVVACEALSKQYKTTHMIGFDMGGTSTDVCQYHGGLDKSYETTIEGHRIKAPILNIHTIAAGGGSLCRWLGGRFTVGPESAGADPGPLCYQQAGTVIDKTAALTVTDINLFLGRIQSEHFPIPLNKERVSQHLERLAKEVASEKDMTVEAIAEGFFNIVTVSMAEAIKTLTLSKGCDARDFVLNCFGGAGAQHACAVARYCGIKKIMIHPMAGILSAYGMSCAPAQWETVVPIDAKDLSQQTIDAGIHILEKQRAMGDQALRDQGIDPKKATLKYYFDLRYVGTDFALTISGAEAQVLTKQFHQQYKDYFGFCHEQKAIEVVNARCELNYNSTINIKSERSSNPLVALKETSFYVQGKWHQIPVFHRDQCEPGQQILGPAMILDPLSTIIVDPGFKASIDEQHMLWLNDIEKKQVPLSQTEKDPILLEVFYRLFMSIAEQMGTSLKRTAMSTNIKERLDFSCAIFDAEGALIANAPHVPVHLGAMSDTVKVMMQHFPHMKPQDVYITNDPYQGGSHLPDITVITPVFDTKKTLQFFVANRAHHAEIGGIAPGSMSPEAHTLEDEGVCIPPTKLISEGHLNEACLTTLFKQGRYPSRDPETNQADVLAQIAANQQGLTLLLRLFDQYSPTVVTAYMTYIQEHAEAYMRQVLSEHQGQYAFTDCMDDGTPIAVKIDISQTGAVVDFSSSGPQVLNNLNAPSAIVNSAVLYAFRCMLKGDIPLNQGCLAPITIILPDRSILNPESPAAVAGGNVETSQRIVDVMLGALDMAAASQGTMNNVTFGNDHFGYYETLGGGVGAAPGYHGASAVQVHMTNTRITDPEIVEQRYPIRLDRFCIRKGSGGQGQFNGGCGLSRKYTFLEPLTVSLLTQRREVSPFGLHGGGAGLVGKNDRIDSDGKQSRLPHVVTYQAKRNESLVIHTPGGGAWG